jgi:hypothetical protein
LSSSGLKGRGGTKAVALNWYIVNGGFIKGFWKVMTLCMLKDLPEKA